MLYTVKWVIDIDADTPRQAAEDALSIMQDTDSEALFFTIFSPDGEEHSVDLYYGEDDES